MKELGCRDLGGDCGFVARADTAEKVKEKLLAHAEKEHAGMIRDLTAAKKQEMISRIDQLLGQPVDKRPAAAV